MFMGKHAIVLEKLVDLKKMKAGFAELDAYMRKKVAELEERSKTGGETYKIAVHAYNCAEERRRN